MGWFWDETNIWLRMFVWDEFTEVMLNAILCVIDSPGIPPSATAHELFRGFSFVAPALLGEDNHVLNPILDNQIALTSVSFVKGYLLALKKECFKRQFRKFCIYN